MKNLSKILILSIFLLVFASGANAQGKKYEVPLKVMNYSEKTQESMSGKAFSDSVEVLETDDSMIYTIKTKTMKLNSLDGNLTKLFFIDKSEKKELASKDLEGEYNKSWELKTAKEKSKELTIAVWVDIMDIMKGGKPGSNEQKAILSLDWNNAKEIAQEIEKEEVKQEPKEEVKANKEEMPKSNSNEISVSVNGKKVEMDAKPYIKNSRTMVPVRFISESLGLKVGWEAKTKTVIIGEQDKVMLVIGQSKITKADKTTVAIDAPAEISNQRTFVPVRAIAEIFNSKVGWDAKTKTVMIDK